MSEILKACHEVDHGVWKNNLHLFIFICSYLARGTVEKLEVVNKKWVRVKTVPGASVDGGVSI